MRIDLDDLPVDTSLLHHLVRDMAAVVESRESEIERFQLVIKKLQRAQFGRRSERLDPDQMALALEDLDSDVARVHESSPAVKTSAEGPPAEARSRRKPLPDHLPREDIRLDVDSQACACCGGALHAIGESVSEMLDWIPAQLRLCASPDQSTPVAPAGRSPRRRPRNARSPAAWRRRRCSRKC